MKWTLAEYKLPELGKKVLIRFFAENKYGTFDEDRYAIVRAHEKNGTFATGYMKWHVENYNEHDITEVYAWKYIPDCELPKQYYWISVNNELPPYFHAPISQMIYICPLTIDSAQVYCGFYNYHSKKWFTTEQVELQDVTHWALNRKRINNGNNTH